MSIDADRLPTPRLDVRDLRVVLALGRYGTTAAAADALHLTQSAVSRALGAAETHAGVELFTRTPRGLVATAAGATLLDAAPALLAELSALERRLRVPPPRASRIRFAAECFMAYPWLTQTIVRLRKHGVRVELPVEHSARAGKALLEGELDAAMLLSRPPPGLSVRPLFADEMLFLVARSHPLAGVSGLRPGDVASTPLLVPNATASDGWFVRAVFGSRRPRLRVERLPVTEAIIELARAGLGMAVLSEWVAASYLREADSDLVALRLRKGPLRRRWRLVHPPELEPTASLLFDAIRSARPVSRGA